MKSRSEVRGAGRQQKMEGVNMPASFKFAWRWLVGATAATMLCLVALPGVGRAENIEICVNQSNGKIKGVNLGVGGCTGNTSELDWVNIGPTGPTGMRGVAGDPGLAGTQGPQGYPGIQGPAGAQGEAGPQGPRALSGRRDLLARQASWVKMESADRRGWSEPPDRLDLRAHPETRSRIFPSSPADRWVRWGTSLTSICREITASELPEPS